MSYSDPGTQPDEEYNLVENLQINGQPYDPNTANPMIGKQCGFCKRRDEPLVGPFCKYDDQKKLVGSPLYFHRMCIENNQYSKYCTRSRKWVNIDKALKELVHNN